MHREVWAIEDLMIGSKSRKAFTQAPKDDPLDVQDFRSGNITTKFIQEHYPQGWQGDYLTDAQEVS